MKKRRLKTQKLAQEFKNRYLAGETIISIAKNAKNKKYKNKNYTIRNIYHLIGELTIEDKALHTKNMWLRKKALPVPTMIKHEIKKERRKSKSVDDFIKS